jgi:hypothetical protein
MRFGFPPTARQQFELTGSLEQRAQVISATFADMGWPHHSTSTTSYKANTPFSIVSYGESVVVDFADDSWATITSSCSVPIQMMDWGKNDQNIRKFMHALNSAQTRLPTQPVIGVADALAEMAHLRTEGLLTEEEFNAQKAKILRGGGA